MLCFLCAWQDWPTTIFCRCWHESCVSQLELVNFISMVFNHFWFWYVCYLTFMPRCETKYVLLDISQFWIQHLPSCFVPTCSDVFRHKPTPAGFPRLEKFVNNRHSPAQLIEHSFLFKACGSNLFGDWGFMCSTMINKNSKNHFTVDTGHFDSTNFSKDILDQDFSSGTVLGICTVGHGLQADRTWTREPCFAHVRYPTTVWLNILVWLSRFESLR